jgi:hypothetical protein
MNYDNTSGPNGRYAAQYRADAKAEPAKNGQTIISNTSILEQGRNAAGVRKVADTYEELGISEDCPIHSRVNRDCDN